MHELSIMQNVVEICQEQAGGRRVTAVTLEVGELSGALAEALEFCFAPCVRGTSLEEAILVVERIPGRGRCRCGTEFAMRVAYTPCPACGELAATVIDGDQLRVRDMEVF